MKKVITSLCCLCLVGTIMSSCGNSKETPESIAGQWCNLNGKVYKAAEGPDKEKAKEERKKFENSVEEKYSKDSVMMEKIKKAAEACEGKSELK